MKKWFVALALLLGLAIGAAPARQPRPPASALRRPGETTVFSFVTAGGKTATLCQGPKAAYLVYRFGTAARVELQYPAVLDAGSWQKFTYFGYHRGGGVRNAGLEDHRLSFSNGGADYELYDRERAVAGKNGTEEYPREIGIAVSLPAGKAVTIVGKEPSSQGGLRLSEEMKERVKLFGED